MFRIVCITSKIDDLSSMAQEFFPPEEYHVEVVTAVLDEAVSIAHKYVEAGYDIIISRGITSKMLQQMFSIPILTIDITYFNLVTALHEASSVCYNLEYFYYRGEDPPAADLSYMLQMLKIDEKRVHLNPFTTGEQIEEILLEKEIDNTVVLGTGRFVIDRADRYGFRTVMIQSSREAIFNTFQEAKRFAQFHSSESHRIHQLRAVLDGVQTGLILLDEDQRVEYISELALHLLGVDYAAVINRPFSAAFDNMALRDIFQRRSFQFPTDNGSSITAELHSLFLKETNYGYAVYLTLSSKEKGSSLMGREPLIKPSSKYSLLGQSAAIEQIRKKTSLYGASEMTVLIYGESGTGKEIIANNLHLASARRDAPFIAVNCATLPQSLLESELFGYEAGSFTGAKREGHAGLFEQANGGTIFLDEISELTLGAQAQLLRVLQEMTIRRVGGNKAITVNVRVIAATNVHLWSLIHAGKFREDLFYRLNVLYLHVPPLRERKDDIPILFNAFVERYQGDKNIQTDEAGVSWLQNYSWPGNVRELMSFAQKFALLYDGSQSAGNLISQLLEESLLIQRSGRETPPPPSEPLPSEESHVPVSTDNRYLTIRVGRLSDMELDIIRQLQKRYPNARSQMAQALGISRSSLWKKLKEIEEMG